MCKSELSQLRKSEQTLARNPREANFACFTTISQAQGKLDEAEEPTRRALAVWENALGPDHLTVATGLNNLALLLKVRGSTT